MEVKKFVAISGMAGVYKLINARNNGLVIENFDTKERLFVPSRAHQFSPFETISVFTDDGDSMPLSEVYKQMHELGKEVPTEKAASGELRAYFLQAVPQHDIDKVHISDIKKCIKWYHFLVSRDLLHPKSEEVEENEDNAKPIEFEIGDGTPLEHAKEILLEELPKIKPPKGSNIKKVTIRQATPEEIEMGNKVGKKGKVK